MGKIVLAEMKIAIYGDYDGNAPDTENLVVCDTQEEAEEIIKDLELVRDDEDEDGKAEARLEEKGVSIPYVEGYQHSLSFNTREVLILMDKNIPYEELLKENAELKLKLGGNK